MASSSYTPHMTFDDVTSTYEKLEDDSVIANLDRYLWIYCSPWILLLGLFGNILIIIVVKSRRVHNSSTTTYLPMLAIFDCFTILTGIIPEWLDAMQIVTIKEISAVTCKLEKFLFYISADTATWILVLFTVDRFVAVCFALQKQSLCTPKCAKIACSVFFVLSITKNAHVFWTRGPEYDQNGNLTSNCGRPEPYTKFELYIRPWIAFVYANLIPFVIIIICNVSIIRKLVQVQKMRRAQTNAEKSMKQTVLMCLSASFTFLIFITPSMALLIGKPYWTSDDDPNYAYNIAKAINNQLVMVNHSINVILYCASGKKFREDVVELFRCRCCPSTRSTLHSSTSEEDKAKKLSKQASASSAHDQLGVTTKNTTMSSLASTPTNDAKDDVSTHLDGKPSSIHQETIEIDIKELANPAKEIGLGEDKHEEQDDKVTEKDSGIGLKDGHHDLAKDSFSTSSHPQPDYLSEKFENDLGGNRLSSTTTSSEDSESWRKDDCKQPTSQTMVHNNTAITLPSHKTAFELVNKGNNSHVNPAFTESTRKSHIPPEETSAVSKLSNVTVTESETDERTTSAPMQGEVLHLQNCVGESTDIIEDTAHAPIVSPRSQSGKLSPVLKVIPMETTHF